MVPTITREEQPVKQSPKDFKPSPNEWWGVMLLLGLSLVLNTITYRIYPTPWVDEVSFSEPAINFAQHLGFVTRVWPYQANNTFPVVNCPLYGLALAGWLKLAGTSLLAVRWLNYFFAALAGFLTWQLAWRGGLIRRPPNRLALIFMVEFGYGMVTAMRSSRPDMLGLVLSLALALALCGKSGSRQNWVLLGLSGALVWTGFQAALFVAFACVISAWLSRAVTKSQVAIIGCGMVLGVLCLFCLLSYQGVLSEFLVSIGSVTDQASSAGQLNGIFKIVQNLVLRSTHNLVDDLALLTLFAGLITLLLLRFLGKYDRTQGQSKRFFLLAVLFVVGTPLLFNALGHFTIFYSYMIFLPAGFLFFAVLEAATVQPPMFHRASQLIMLFTISLVFMLGLPLRLALPELFLACQASQPIFDLLSENLMTKDVVFCDYQVFFEVKNRVSAVFVPDHLAAYQSTRYPKRELSYAEKASISLLIVNPYDLNDLIRWLGGIWTPVGKPLEWTVRPAVIRQTTWFDNKLKHYFSQSPNGKRSLQIYRRTDKVVD